MESNITFQDLGLSEAMLKAFYESIAGEVIAALDRIVAQKSWLKSEDVLRQYQTAVQSIGGSMAQRLTAEKLQELANRKIANGIH